MPDSINYFKQDTSPVIPAPLGSGDVKVVLDGNSKKFPWSIAIIIIVFFAILFGGAYYYFYSNGYLIKSYDECVNAGYPIQESYPAACTTQSGRRFTEPLPSFTPAPQSSEFPQPVITNPVANALITSPLKVEGELPPGWMFEGITSIDLVDDSGDILVQSRAQEVVPGSWQSGNSVKFSADLTFSATTKQGMIIIRKANPSGLPENDEAYTLPVNFE